ncbi:PQQ-binding-like beta-propeller repeat protein [Streptomyces fagopyri]|uniref:outer membrane protein assembly factor BamB family protein n=1 Tax=Streptomyces fagopyri TaxID=2662397 RepID=UPI0037122B8D
MGGSGEPPEPTPRAARRRAARVPLLVGVGLLLLAVVHQARPAPYGDRLVPHARVDRAQGTPPPPRPPLRTTGGAVEAYDAATGRARWTYAREGHRPLAVLPARGHAIALWDDGLVTDTTRHDGGAVRWHRALPGTARWLADHGTTGVLRLLGDGMLAVITPERVVAYRVADGDLRWILPARPGCRFVPARAVRHGAVLLIARPCPAEDRWTAGLVAVDDLGIVAPHRAPLGNGQWGEGHGAEHPRTGKVVAPPR